MTAEFHPEAAREFVESARYYHEAREGLGRRFRHAVVDAINRVMRFPEIGTAGTAWRRHPVAGFPYHIVYRVNGDVLEVLALSHHRRRPGYWKDRLSLHR